MKFKMLLVMKRIEIFRLNETNIKRHKLQERKDKFGTDREIYSSVEHVEERGYDLD